MPRRSIEPDVFDLEPLALRGGYSKTSGQYHFPLQPVCPYSGADDVEAVTLSSVATVWGWTVVTSPPPGYAGEVPYGFGVVELVVERLRVITRLAITAPDELQFGETVRLGAQTVAVDDDGTEVCTWSFGR